MNWKGNKHLIRVFDSLFGECWDTCEGFDEYKFRCLVSYSLSDEEITDEEKAKTLDEVVAKYQEKWDELLEHHYYYRNWDLSSVDYG